MQLGQQTANIDDFQEAGPEESEALKLNSMDDALENKICELYDLYVEVKIKFSSTMTVLHHSIHKK